MIYETQANEDEEASVAAYVSAVYGVAMYKTPQFSVVDYIATRDQKAVALIEIKCRRMSIEDVGARGGYLISLTKLEKMQMLSDTLRLPAVLIVMFDQKVYEYIVGRDQYDSVIPFNRNDRPNEREMAAVIYTTRFRRLK